MADKGGRGGQANAKMADKGGEVRETMKVTDKGGWLAAFGGINFFSKYMLLHFPSNLLGPKEMF